MLKFVAVEDPLDHSRQYNNLDNITTETQRNPNYDTTLFLPCSPVHIHPLYNPSMTTKDPLATSGLPPSKREEVFEEGQPDEPQFLILVVDDAADNLAMISLALQQQGYKVVTAANGEDAVTVATQTRPNLILMDINLPELDGLGATRRILENENLRDVPVVVVTAFGTEGFSPQTHTD